MRQTQARLPYSKMLPMAKSRWPGQGRAPKTSARQASEYASPCRSEYSPPSSSFSTICTAIAAPSGQRGSGGLRPCPIRSRRQFELAG
jgi:hypothetical protein